MVSEIISRRREELADWRQRMEVSVREVDARRRQIDANLVRIEQRSIQLNGTLRTKLEPRFAEAIQDLNSERDQLFKAIHDVDVSDIIGVTANDGAGAAQSRFQNQLNEVPLKLDGLKTKQEQILADQRLALEVVQNCNEVLRQMLSTSPKKNADGRQSQDGAGSSTASASGCSPAIRFGDRSSARRGRIFPHPVSERRDFEAEASAANQSLEERLLERFASGVNPLNESQSLAQAANRPDEAAASLGWRRMLLGSGGPNTSGEEDALSDDDGNFPTIVARPRVRRITQGKKTFTYS